MELHDAVNTVAFGFNIFYLFHCQKEFKVWAKLMKLSEQDL